MPLHYPRYTKRDYKKMEEGKLDLLLKQYGLYFDGTLKGDIAELPMHMLGTQTHL